LEVGPSNFGAWHLTRTPVLPIITRLGRGLERVNILFTGITGVKKKQVMAALAERRIAALAPAYPDIAGLPPTDEKVRRLIRYCDVDDYWGSPVEAVLTDGEISQIRKDWGAAFQRAAAEVAGAQLDRFLAIHPTYFWNCRPSIPASLGAIASFQPHAFVSLIDDCYAIWWRVKKKDEQAKRGAYLRLQDVLRWRQFDLWVSQQLVNDLSSVQPDVPPALHHVVAVKHPVDTLYKLIFEPRCLRVYGAHPISDVRAAADCVAEISRIYQHPLKQEFALIEPAAIDEKPVQFALDEQFCPESAGLGELGNNSVQLKVASRWPVLEPVVPDDAEMFVAGELQLNAAEAFQVAGVRDKQGNTEIDLQIRERDFWLVRMCHRVGGYRPYWADRCPLGSQGVIEELNLAARLHKMPRYIGADPSGTHDTPGRAASPLHDKVGLVGSVAELVEALRYDQAEMRGE
jgi:hypothetical protein